MIYKREVELRKTLNEIGRLMETFQKSDIELSNVFFSDRKLFMSLLQRVNNEVVGNESISIKGHNQNTLGRTITQQSQPLHKLKRRVINLIKTIVGNIGLVTKLRCKIGVAYCLGSRCAIAEKYCRDNSYFIVYVEPEQLLTKNSIEAVVTEQYNDFVPTFVARLNTILIANGHQKVSTAEFYEFTSSFDASYQYFKDVKQKVQDRGTPILANNVYFPHINLFTFACQAKGMKIIACSHGNDLGYLNEYYHLKFSISPYHYFLVENDLARNNFADALNHLGSNSTTIISADQHAETEIAKTGVSDADYYLIGFPFSSKIYFDIPYGYTDARKMIELAVNAAFKELIPNKQLIYKAHPTTLKTLNKGYLGQFSTIEKGPFEETVPAYSTLIFTHPSSSTFFYAYTRPFPIILLVPKTDLTLNFTHRSFERMLDRIEILQYDFDNSGFMLDSNLLIDSIKSAKLKNQRFWNTNQPQN